MGDLWANGAMREWAFTMRITMLILTQLALDYFGWGRMITGDRYDMISTTRTAP